MSYFVHRLTGGQADRQTDGQTTGWKDRQTNSLKNITSLAKQTKKKVQSGPVTMWVEFGVDWIIVNMHNVCN